MDYQYADPDEVIDFINAAFRPPPKLTVSEFSDEYRRLSAESSAAPGRYRTSRTEYMREPMDMVGRPEVRRIVLMTSAQVAKSTVVENVVAYLMAYDPCPILHVSPTLESMKMFSKERLAPMIRDTPVLRDIVKDARSRDSGNTLSSKTFPGGHIAMVGSNAPAGLASRPVRVVVADEVDRFEASAGTEGDPLSLAIKRTTTYWNKILLFVSTPGDKGKSRIEKEFLAGDQRYRWCPCPHCGEYQRLIWSQVKWDDNDPETARYVCEHNGCVWDDTERNKAVFEGEWRAEKPFNGSVSYHLSQLYSPFALLSDGVRDFLAAKGDPQLLKTWVNTFLGETWEDKGKRLDWSDIMDHREEYDPDEVIPEDTTVVTVAIDTQDDRFEVEYVGWCVDERTYSLGYHVVYGDLSTVEPWAELETLLRSTSFIHPLFGEMTYRAGVMDSGGHYTTDVYKFCQRMPRLAAIKGVAGFSRPFIGRPMKNTIGDYRVFPVGVDSLKIQVVNRLRVADPDKAGYCSFPMNYDDEYFRMLTAEELRDTYRRGHRKQEWVKIRRRNEAFDLRVYNTAALEMLSVNLKSMRRALLQNHKVHDTPTSDKPKQSPRRKQSSWVKGWKND